MSAVRIGIVGAGGRMGRALIKAVADTDGAVLAAAVEQPNSSLIGQDAGGLAGLPASGVAVSGDVASAFRSVDVAIDFTAPAASVEHARAAAAAGCALVIGATGVSAGETAAIAAAAKDIPIKPNIAFIGEVGLAGELRRVPGLHRRLAEAARLGFTEAVVPSDSHAAEQLSMNRSGMLIRAVPTLADALCALNMTSRNRPN